MIFNGSTKKTRFILFLKKSVNVYEQSSFKVWYCLVVLNFFCCFAHYTLRGNRRAIVKGRRKKERCYSKAEFCRPPGTKQNRKKDRKCAGCKQPNSKLLLSLLNLSDSEICNDTRRQPEWGTEAIGKISPEMFGA